jgi:hypothetical protein
MAGKIVADTIESAGSQISLNVGNVTILTASSTGLTLIPTTNVNVNLTNSIVTLTNGSATSPGLTFSGNTRTGLFMPAANTLAFTAANTESMRIDSSGNVGIGTNSPSGKLHVETAGTNYIYSRNGSASGIAGIICQNTTDTRGWRIDGTNFDMYDHSAGATRMRIDTGGNLLVGKTAVSTGTNGVELTATGITATNTGAEAANFNRQTSDGTLVIFRRQTSGVGTIAVTTTATTYNTTSDYRLKKDIQPMTGALSRVNTLKPVTYKWKSNDSDGEGFIAHELAEVCPHAVTGEKDDVDAEGNPVYQVMDSSFLIATLTAAIQELKAIVDAQAVEIAALKA